MYTELSSSALLSPIRSTSCLPHASCAVHTRLFSIHYDALNAKVYGGGGVPRQQAHRTRILLARRVGSRAPARRGESESFVVAVVFTSLRMKAKMTCAKRRRKQARIMPHASNAAMSTTQNLISTPARHPAPRLDAIHPNVFEGSCRLKCS